MHKDPPPGLFDFSRRTLGYTVGAGLISGFIISIFVCVGLFVWRADSGPTNASKASAMEMEAKMTARPKRPPTPAPTAAVRY